MPSVELRTVKLAKIKDRDECVLRIEAASNDATRILDELRSASFERFRGNCATEVSGGIERLRRVGAGAVVLDLTSPDDHGVETSGKPSVAALRGPLLLQSWSATEKMTLQAIQREARTHLVNYYAGDSRLPQRCAR